VNKGINCINRKAKRFRCRNGSQCGNTSAEKGRYWRREKVTIPRCHNATDLELERVETRRGILKEGSCRRKTARISFSKDVQVAPNVEMRILVPALIKPILSRVKER
jgi:hypothetical protein